jgi:ArsR family transcriptional regulator, arsenate/arsenite/antimonite-responsive transcriptional repressor
MDESGALLALAALGQPARLTAFRLLVQAGPEGLPAGEIAQRLDVPHNTLSTHLALLARAGLVAADRRGRSVVYRAAIGGVRSLVEFLLRDCCGGRAEACAPLLDAVLELRCCTPGMKEIRA